MVFLPSNPLQWSNGDSVVSINGQTLQTNAFDVQPAAAGAPQLEWSDGSAMQWAGSQVVEPSGETATANLILGLFDDDALLPDSISRRSHGGPGFRTVLQTTQDGDCIAISKASRARIGLDLAFATRTPATAHIVSSFYRSRRGSLGGFRVNDPLDRSTHTDLYSTPDPTNYQHRHLIGAGDGTTKAFQLVVHYRSGHWDRVRPITRPDRFNAGSVRVFLDGVEKTIGTDFQVTYGGGIVTFTTAPAAGVAIEWCGYYQVPMRFTVQGDESLRTEAESTTSYNAGSIGLTEIVDEVQFADPRFGGGVVERSSTGHTVMSISDGLVWFVAPASNGLVVYLPPVASLDYGGPICYLVNAAANGSGRNLVVKAQEPPSFSTVVTSLTPQAMVVFFLDSNGTTWHATT